MYVLAICGIFQFWDEHKTEVIQSDLVGPLLVVDVVDPFSFVCSSCCKSWRIFSAAPSVKTWRSERSSGRWEGGSNLELTFDMAKICKNMALLYV